MADLSSEDRRRIEEEVAEAVAEAERARPETTAAAAAARALPDPEIFCDNWPTAKRVLEFLLPFVPDPYKRYVQILITAGDRLHQLVCR